MRYARCTQFHAAIFGLILGLSASVAGNEARAQDQQSLTASSSGQVMLAGAVFSNSGQPLAGATVEVSGHRLSTASTNSEGYFLLPVPADEPVQLRVSFPEHEPELVELKRPGQEKNLVVTLQSLGKQKSKVMRARQKQFQRSTR